MYILSIDTSHYASTAVSFNNKVLSFEKTSQKSMQSESIVKMIENCLKNAKINYSELSVVGLNIGVGSFTGIRVGVAAANSIAIYNPKIKMCEINYFEVLASRMKYVNKYDYIAVISEYTKVNSVLQIFKNNTVNNSATNNNKETVSDLMFLKNEDLIKEISKLDDVVVICGSGLKNIFFQINDTKKFIVLPRSMYTDARPMPDLIFKKILKNDYVDEFRPIYI